MRKVTNYKIIKESFEDMLDAGRFNACLEITFRDKSGKHVHKLGSGYNDDICVYRENGITFVLTQNPRLGYIGLDAFEGNKKLGEIFLEGHQANETLGRDDLAPFTIIRKLMEFVM